MYFGVQERYYGLICALDDRSFARYLGSSNDREAQTIVISRFIRQISGASLNFHGPGAGLFLKSFRNSPYFTSENYQAALGLD